MVRTNNPLRNSKILTLCGVFSIFTFFFVIIPEFQSHMPIPISIDVEPIQLTSELLDPIYGYNNYSEFIQGHLPIIISAPHGGHLFPEHIPDRKQTFPSVVKSNDINTQEIARELSDLIAEKFKGRRPYMVINHLGRSKLDVNRPLREGAESNPDSNLPSETQIVWNDYHTFMTNAVEEIEERFGRGILIDIHGHGHPENYIELGYVLSSETLTRYADVIDSNPKIAASSSIRALYNRKQSSLKFSELLYGKTTSLGGRLQSYGYETVPSYTRKHPSVNERYFHGGYSVQKYGSRHGEQVVDAIQIELPRLLRLGNKVLKGKFITDFSESLSWFVKEYYWNGGKGSKRLTIDIVRYNN